MRTVISLAAPQSRPTRRPRIRALHKLCSPLFRLGSVERLATSNFIVRSSGCARTRHLSQMSANTVTSINLPQCQYEESRWTPSRATARNTSHAVTDVPQPKIEELRSTIIISPSPGVSCSIPSNQHCQVLGIDCALAHLAVLPRH